MHTRVLPHLMLPALVLAACAKSEPPAEQAAAAPAPVAPNMVHVTATEYAFQAPLTLPSGVTTFHLMNEGKEVHHLVLLKIPLADFQKAEWLEKPQGHPPGALINGALPMIAGVANTTTVDLTAGDYGLICFVPDSKDGKPPTVHGMVKQITVS